MPDRLPPAPEPPQLEEAKLQSTRDDDKVYLKSLSDARAGQWPNTLEVRPAPPHVLRPIRNESRFGHAMPRRARRLTPRSASPHRRLAARARRLHVSPMRRLRSRRVARPTAPRRPPARLPDARASSAPIENSTTRRTASNPSIPPSSLATSSRSARRRSSTRNSRRPSAQSTTRSSSKNSAARRSSRPRRRLAKRWSARCERFVNATISWHSWKSSATTSAPSATSIASRAP